jgi:hypothetical protein
MWYHVYEINNETESRVVVYNKSANKRERIKCAVL